MTDATHKNPRRFAALEAFHVSVTQFLKNYPIDISDVVDASILEVLEETRPLTPEERQGRMLDYVRRTNELLPIPVDQSTRDYVIKYIDAHQMTPYHTCSSLHIWEERYKVDGECYSVWGELSTKGTVGGVDLIMNPVDKV